MVSARFHIVQEFNKGIYEYIIASDESGSRGETDQQSSDEENEDDELEEGESEAQVEDDENTTLDDHVNSKDHGMLLLSPSLFHRLRVLPIESESEEDASKDESEGDEENNKDAEADPNNAPLSSRKRKQSSIHTSPTPPSKRSKLDASEPSPSPSASHPQFEPRNSKKQKKQKKAQRGPKGTTAPDKEFGVSRGVDFIDVACVINFDLPTSSRGYTHRIGRTARAGRSGLAISFVVDSSQWSINSRGEPVRKNDSKSRAVVSLESTRFDDRVFKRIEKEQGARGSKIKEYEFDMRQVEAFRYRMEDALRAVTKVGIKEARVKELKTEILNSDRLKVSNVVLSIDHEMR